MPDRTSKPSNADINEVTKEQQREAGDTPDSSKQFAEAGHQAREDAAGTPDEVRPAKDEATKERIANEKSDEE